MKCNLSPGLLDLNCSWEYLVHFSDLSSTRSGVLKRTGHERWGPVALLEFGLLREWVDCLLFVVFTIGNFFLLVRLIVPVHELLHLLGFVHEHNRKLVLASS